MRRAVIVFGVLVIGLIAYGVGVWTYRATILSEGLAIAGEDRACLFNGFYSPSNVPIARLVPADQPFFQPWSDLHDRYVNGEPAKPFHFGMIVLRPGEIGRPQAEIWGWSYRRSEFWTEGALNPFSGAFRGDPVAQCLAGAD